MSLTTRYLPALFQPPASLYPGGGLSWQAGEPSAASGSLTPPNWMDPRVADTPGYYPHALLSYQHWQGMRFRFPKDAYLFGDSGGFSIMTLGVAVDPLDALRWQMRTCDVGVVLDVPPFNTAGERTWASSLEATLRNIRRALPMYLKAREEGTAFRWWGVAHGGTRDELTEWYSAVRDVYPFDDEGEGWAFKPMPRINPVTCARVLGFIAEHRVRGAHFLMTTGTPALATLFALGRARTSLEFLTYDSSSASRAGINRTVYALSEDGLSFEPVIEKFRATDGADQRAREHLAECPCLSCIELRRELDESPGLVTDEHWRFRMIYHNVLIHLDAFSALDELTASTPEHEALPEILGAKTYHAALRAFENREAVTAERGTPQSLLDLL